MFHVYCERPGYSIYSLEDLLQHLRKKDANQKKSYRETIWRILGTYFLHGSPFLARNPLRLFIRVVLIKLTWLKWKKVSFVAFEKKKNSSPPVDSIIPSHNLADVNDFQATFLPFFFPELSLLVASLGPLGDFCPTFDTSCQNPASWICKLAWKRWRGKLASIREKEGLVNLVFKHFDARYFLPTPMPSQWMNQAHRERWT